MSSLPQESSLLGAVEERRERVRDARQVDCQRGHLLNNPADTILERHSDLPQRQLALALSRTSVAWAPTLPDI